VKKSITYREITIAIGILVAMVIALTLWTRVPEKKLSGPGGTSGHVSLPSTARYLLGATLEIFSPNAAVDLPLERP